MSALTPEEAVAKWRCPNARTFASSVDGNCIADNCPLWRWLPLPADDAFKNAIKERMRVAQEGHKAAVAWVQANRKEAGLPERPAHGYCGQGGEVRA